MQAARDFSLFPNPKASLDSALEGGSHNHYSSNSIGAVVVPRSRQVSSSAYTIA